METPAAPALKTIDGYELLEKLGQGGMGAVFKARQVSMDRIVALKILPPKFAKDKEYVDRFVREARLAGRLNHENVVQAIGVGSENGYHYISMEYVEGTNLRQIIQANGALSEKEALRITRQVVLGLDCAHKNGLIHRDIKPDNIMIDKRGTIKVADLGLARERKENTSLTQTGMALGTPHYASPEQARGDKDLDHRADFYSLGATLYHALTGKTPFEATSGAALMAKHLIEEPPPPRVRNPKVRISDESCALLERLMKKNKAERPADAQELLVELDEILDGLDVAAKGVATRRTGRHAAVDSGARRRRRTTGTFVPLGARVDGSERSHESLATRKLTGAAPRQAAPAPNHLPLAAGGLAAALILGVGVYMLSGSKAPPFKQAEPRKAPVVQPSTPPATPVRNPVSEAPAPVPLPALNAEQEYQQVLTQVNALPHDPEAANRLLQSYAGAHAGSPEAQQAHNLIAKINTDRNQQERNRAKAAAEAASSSLTAPLTPAGPIVAQAMQAPEPVAAPVAAPGAPDKAASEHAALRMQVAGLMQERAFEKARLALEGIQKKTPLPEDLASQAALLKDVAGFFAQAERNTEALKDKMVKMDEKYAPGKVLGWDAERSEVIFGISGGKLARSLRDKSMPAATALQFFDAKDNTSPQAALLRAAFNLAQNDPDAALADAKAAGAAGGHYLKRAEQLKGEKVAAATVKKAREAFDGVKRDVAEARKKDARSRPKGAAEKLETWLNQFKEHDALEAERKEAEKLLAEFQDEPGMVLVKGGNGKPDFWMDKYEVRNKEYAEFVKWMLGNGDYKECKARLESVFPKDLSMDRAPEPYAFTPNYMPEFDAVVDMMRKGLGKGDGDEHKRSNSEGKRRAEELGKLDYPVTCVPWFAAMAYAKWRGKQLPTREQWQRAAREKESQDMPAGIWNPQTDAPKYNGGNQFEFRDKYEGLAPVESMPEGKSHAGCHHMSGNVWEFLRERGRCIGGSYRRCQGHLSLNCDDGETRIEPWVRDDQHGFRCMKEVAQP